MGEQKNRSGPGNSRTKEDPVKETVNDERLPEHMDSDIERANVQGSGRAEQMSHADTPSSVGTDVETSRDSEKADPRVAEELNESKRGDDNL